MKLHKEEKSKLETGGGETVNINISSLIIDRNKILK